MPLEEPWEEGGCIHNIPLGRIPRIFFKTKYEPSQLVLGWSKDPVHSGYTDKIVCAHCDSADILAAANCTEQLARQETSSFLVASNLGTDCQSPNFLPRL